MRDNKIDTVKLEVKIEMEEMEAMEAILCDLMAVGLGSPQRAMGKYIYKVYNKPCHCLMLRLTVPLT